MNGALTTSAQKKMTLDGFRSAMDTGRKLAMLTCYDFSTARLLERAGIQLLLVGDSAANTILGYDSTLPVSLEFMIEITRAVRKGAPNSFVMADLPFGSFSTRSQGLHNAVRLVKETGADSVKIECTRGHLGLVQGLADAGVAVFAHLGLTPQKVGLIGGYKAQGRTAHDALMIADLAADFANSGAAGILLETVPPQVSEIICGHLDVPVIGCGAGPACHAHVVVLHDLLGLSERNPKFAPNLGDGGATIIKAAERYAADIVSGDYPKPAHCYEMPKDELAELKQQVKHWSGDVDE